MSVSFDFSGKTVFVSGGTSGINLGVAEGFAGAGARVFVISRSQEKVDAAVEQLKAAGAEAADGRSADVRDHDAVKQTFEDCVGQFGEIDILVSGAAGNFPAMANDISSNGFRAVMEIDVLGTHHVMTAAYPHLKKPGASVINISAPQSVIPMQAQVHVCAAKAGVDMITKVLALEWGGEGIRVNSVIPGPIEDTEGMRRLAPGEKAMEFVRQTVPLQRNGKARDIANMCMMLSSDAADYVSGVIVPVDGAWYLGGVGSAMDGIMKAMKGAS